MKIIVNGPAENCYANLEMSYCPAENTEEKDLRFLKTLWSLWLSSDNRFLMAGAGILWEKRQQQQKPQWAETTLKQEKAFCYF